MERLINLRNGDLSATVDLSAGASCISFRDKRYGAVILREPDRERGMDNPFLYGIPLLYPVNRISGGSFEFESRRYVYPINEPRTGCHLHGDLHSAVFTLIESTENTMGACYVSEAREGFPHRFRVETRYELNESSLIHRVSVTNLSDMRMPHFIGFHTTFNVPFIEGGRAEDVRILCQIGDEIERDMSVYLPTGKILPTDKVTELLRAGEYAPLSEGALSRHYKALGEGLMEIIDVAKGLRLHYDIDSALGFRLLYNGGAKEFICLEPQSCMANCQNAPFDRRFSGFDFIEPGESKEYTMKIYITEDEK